MKKLLVLVLIIGLGVLLWFLLSRNLVEPVADEKPSTAADSVQKTPSPSVAPKSSQVLKSPADKYPRWEGGRSTGLNDPRWKTLNERDQADRAWRGKVEIEFYGKVVDEGNHPVEGAAIKFSKGDLSSEGTTQLRTQSDASGLFSLTGVVGRGMVITVEKEGYYTSKLNRYAFEYAEFSDENFYQPDSINPVIFRLRKKQEADPLIYREQELKIGVGTGSEVTFDTGVKLRIELLTNPRPKQGLWSMRVSALNGGLQTSVEEFPFMAPTNDYQSSLSLDNSTPKPPRWTEIYEGGMLYLKSGANYGRIEIQMISGKDWMRIKTWLNPKPGSRNLELDPKKAITLKL